MAEQESNVADQSAAELPEDAAVGKSSILGKIKVAGFVTVIIALECVAAYMYLPSAAETAELAQGTLAPELAVDETAEEAASENEEELDLGNQLEVDLGEFSVTAFQPISNTTLRIDFRLFGTIDKEEEEDFLLLWESSLHRFRDQVILTVRSADITDLTDAGLGLIKRRVLEKANKTLGKPLLQTVIFSDFSLIEQ